MRRITSLIRYSWLALPLMLAWPALAVAVSLGNIEVANHLGEPFFAEVPLQLEPGEKINNVFVDLANPDDYRILEVFRPKGLNAIRSNIVSDSRGQRVEISSDSPIRMAFFNLVLKLRYGRATHFKKFPIVLDLPKVLAKPGTSLPSDLPWKNPDKAVPATAPVKPDAKVQTEPVIAEAPGTASDAGTGGEAESAPEAKEVKRFKPFDGWARTDRYGPMAFGDTVTTVARRLRIDERYTLPQVIVALYNKNREKFSQDNINLIKKGTFLDTPKAAEVESLDTRKAREILNKHNRRWHKLVQQSKFKAVAEAQKNRYTKRIRVGEEAMVPAVSREVAAESHDVAPAKEAAPQVPVKQAGSATEAMAEVKVLQQHNAELEQRLIDAEKQLSALSTRIAHPAKNKPLKRLEKQINRLQSELQRFAARGPDLQIGGIQMYYILAGAIVLLLTIILFMLGRQRAYVRALNAKAAVPQDTGGKEHRESVKPRVEGAVSEDRKSGAGFKGPEAELLTESMVKNIPPEPFAEGVDPNMDYLAEVEGYLRYGMEEEAIKNVRMAILQQADNIEAHCKLINILAGRDRNELDAAIIAGKAALTGESLQRFEAEVERVREGKEASPESALPDSGETSPDETISMQTAHASGSPAKAEGKEAEGTSSDENPEMEASDNLDEIEWPDFEAEQNLEEEKTEIGSYEELIKDEEGHEPEIDLSGDFPDFEIDSELGEVSQRSSGIETETQPPPPSSETQQDVKIDLGPEMLKIDIARSLLASGSIDEAEELFKRALNGDRHCQALLGLAASAKARGDAETMRSLLAQAEPLLDESTKDWFDRLKS